MYDLFLGDVNTLHNGYNNSDNSDNNHIKDLKNSKESYFKINKLPLNFDTWQADFITSHTYKK
jgi:hypothetical protein